MNSKQKFRARLVLICFLLIAIFIAYNLYIKQIVNGSTYISKANKQYVKPPNSFFNRGSIYFKTKEGTNVSAATVSFGYLLYINPKLLNDAENVYTALSHYITLNKDDFLTKANRKTDPYEELVHRVDEKTALSIKALNISGINVIKESWRSYPGNELSARTIGIIGQSKNSGFEGRYGLEKQYENILKRNSSVEGISAFAGLFSDIKNTVLGDETVQGSVVTSLEPTVQKYTERILRQTSNTWKPDEIGAIIMDPKSGEIISMASLPTFDPNDLSDIKDLSLFNNPLIEHVYEMGSILKPLTMAVGLDSGAIDKAWTYDDTGTMTLSGKKISNFDGKARGKTGVQEILSQSLNVGSANIALAVGKDDFEKYFKSFGLGDKTGVDQPNEATGIIRNLITGRDIEIATAAYGQGIAMSPIAIVRALAVLANGGYMIKPRIVKEINYENGKVEKFESTKSIKVLKKQTTDDVTKMLVNVVDTALKKGELKIEHYSMAAKTGTAQIPDPTNKGYYKDRYLHSFFGYFPAYNPKFIVFIYQIYPKGAQYASETLADPFGDIAKFLIDYYNIPPDR